MDAITITTSLLELLAGIGVFLIACGMMSGNLESLGSKKLKSLFAKASKSKLIGVGVGAAATAAIQSSSATTVMVIGFVNAGIMSLTQAATVIFGANIGTTITGQIVALGMFSGTVSASVIFAALSGIGAFIYTFAKKDAVQKIGGIVAGFGMIFVGLSLMSGSMKSFADAPSVPTILALFEDPFLLVFIGAVFTALIQSSSVTTSIAITMVVSGLIDLNQGVYLTMGSNIGTCATALFAGLSGGSNAKRASLLHLIFNVSGVVVFLAAGIIMRICGTDYGFIFQKIFPDAPQTQLAMFHTAFNLTTVIIVLPFTDLMVKLVTKLVRGKPEKPKKGEPRFYYVNDYMLATPPLAVNQIKKEIVNMAHVAMQNFSAACEIICSLDFSQIETFRDNEKFLDHVNKQLPSYMVKLLKARLNEKDRIYLSTVFRSVSDLERVGDYAENIIEYAEKLRSAQAEFSDNAKEQILKLKNVIDSLFAQSVKAYKDVNLSALKSANEIEDEVDAITAQMNASYIEGLTPEAGACFLSLSSDAERVADHFINVAKTITQTAKGGK